MRTCLPCLAPAIAAWSFALAAWAEAPKSTPWLLAKSFAAPEAIQAALSFAAQALRADVIYPNTGEAA